MINLDYLCVKYGQQLLINDKSENILQKALGVLREDGVYAMFLWIENKDKKVRENLIPLLNDRSIKNFLLQDSSEFPTEFKDFCEKLKDVSQDLDKLLFLKKILERTLIYGLYHAKVKGEENVEKA